MLNISHGAFEGSYQVFNGWREALEELSNLHLRHDAYTDQNQEGRWERLPHDPMVVILIHQDAFGTIPQEIAGSLADRLQELLDQGQEPDEWDYAGFINITRKFIKGLREAAQDQRDLVFH